MPDIIITPSSGIIDFFPVATRVGRIEGSGNTINIVNPSGFVAVSGSGLSINTSSPNATFHAYSAVSGATLLNLEGTNGSLFSVIDNLSGTLMSVNNNAGLPVFEVFSDDRVVAGRFGQNDFIMTSGGNVGIGTGVPSSKFHVVGSVLFSSGLSVSGLITSNSGNFINSLTVNSTGVSISGHTHTSSDITNFNSSVSGLVSGIYAPLSSPALIGTPTAPTASSGTNTTQIASTAFVRTEISNLVSSAPATLDTLNELATALGNDASFSTTVTTSLAGKANLSGATFTGSVSGPSGNFTSLKVNSVDVSAVGHTHTSSNITDFNSSVSGLLPTIANSGDNRVLTSTGGSVGVNAESNLTFNGNLLSVTGSGSFSNNVTASGFVRSGGTSSQFLKADGSVDSTAYTTNVGTVTSVAALTLGTTGTDVTSTVATNTTTPVITLNIPTASASNRGVLSSTDWTTFNNKQATLSNPVTGTGTTSYLPKWTSSSGIGNSLIFDNGTNVGIGISSPSHKLDVSGVIRSTSYITSDTEFRLNNLTFARVATMDGGGGFAGGYNVYLSGSTPKHSVSGSISSYYYYSDGTIRFYTNSSQSADTNASERLRITSAGNVGIGTATPSQALQVGPTTPIGSTPYALINGLRIGGGDTSNTIWNENRDISITRDSGGKIYICRNSVPTVGMNVDTTTGDVGIGTITPGAKLHVIGSGIFSSGIAVSGDVLATGSFVAGSGSAGNPSFEFTGDPDTGLFSPSANAIGLATSGVERLRINSIGNIGIGTSNPSHTLHVAGSGRMDLGLINTTGVFVPVGGTPGSNYARLNVNGAIYCADNGTAGNAIYSSGAISTWDSSQSAGYEWQQGQTVVLTFSGGESLTFVGGILVANGGFTN